MQYTEIRKTFGDRGDEKPLPGEMFVYYDAQGVPQMVDFLCPCGCGNTCPTHVISLEEKKNDPKGVWKNACWGFDVKSLTLYPSIKWTGGCKAHFNIEQGKAIFHADSGK